MYNIDAPISSLLEEKFQNALELVSMEEFAQMVSVHALLTSQVQIAKLKILTTTQVCLKKVFFQALDQKSTFCSSMQSCSFLSLLFSPLLIFSVRKDKRLFKGKMKNKKPLTVIQMQLLAIQEEIQPDSQDTRIID